MFANRAAAWYATRPGEEQRRLRYERLAALLQAGRLQEATSALDPNCTANCEGLQCLAWTGVIAALRGDSALARRQSSLIAGLQLTPRSLQGVQSYCLAVIAAAQGDVDTAVEELRRASGLGISHGRSFHGDPLLAPLRNHLAFKEILRPKG